MIEGLKVTVTGLELRTLAEQRAKFHEDRAAFYESQKEALPDIDQSVPQFSNMSKQPQEMLAERIRTHRAEASELRFIASHLKLEEEYLTTPIWRSWVSLRSAIEP